MNHTPVRIGMLGNFPVGITAVSKPCRISPSHYREVPWRNGRGLSWEIAVDDNHPTSQSGMFNWRFAISAIEDDGAFSMFSGIDRTIALLDGNGFELAVDSNGVQSRLSLIDIGDCQSFAGDHPTKCSLRNGPVRVLNMMSARGLWRANVSVIAGGQRPDISVSADVLLMFAMTDELDVIIDDVPLVMRTLETVCIESKEGAVQPNNHSRIASGRPLAGALYIAELHRVNT